MAFHRGLAFLIGLFCLLFTAGFGSSSQGQLDGKALLKRFQKAQEQQLKSLQSREASNLNELKKDQEARQKSFDKTEKDRRREFFKEMHPGEEKRAYMKALLNRRDELRKQLSDERTRAKEQSDAKVQALKDQQKLNLQRFREFLDRGQRPDDSLWPR